MTTANKVTILRILLIPFFVIEVLYYVKNGHELHWIFAIATFATAALCDALDGFIARRFNQKSELGAILDPVADKLLLVSAIVMLSFDHQPYLESIPYWATGVIIGRDVILILGFGILQLVAGTFTVRPRVLGKVATVLQMFMVLAILLKGKGLWVTVIAGAAAVCTGVSGLLYVSDWMRQLSAHPSSSPTKTKT